MASLSGTVVALALDPRRVCASVAREAITYGPRAIVLVRWPRHMSYDIVQTELVSLANRRRIGDTKVKRTITLDFDSMLDLRAL